ncbi:MAG: glycerol-3-phosphate 1-O-acyltransferase PlsY [Clostridia bacterium]|nr:glycerol-3-phosphate 1-O-acyltransferase PlsY [Clostridia bacterium]
MNYLLYTLAVVAGYLIGSISCSVVLTKLHYKTDVRTQGSGNAGATNVARVFGMKAGVLTLLGDVLKTVVSMLIGKLLGGDVGLALAGGACLIGHAWPIYFKFKGGKGISVGAGLALMVDWRILVIIASVFAIVFILTRIVSAASVCAAVSIVPAVLIVGAPLAPTIMICCAGPLVIWLHRSNIVRLIKGEEKKFVPKSKSK